MIEMSAIRRLVLLLDRSSDGPFLKEVLPPQAAMPLNNKKAVRS